MPLPSSVPVNKVQAQLAPPGPQINLADYTLNPDQIMQSASMGNNLANQIGDSITVRPKQQAAAAAQADAQNQVAQTTSAQTQADRSLIPLATDAQRTLIPVRSQEEAARLGAQTTEDQTQQLLNAVKKTVAANPDFANALKTTLVTQQQTQSDTAQHDKTIADSAVKTAPQEAQTRAYDVSAANNAADDKATAAAQFDTKAGNVQKLTNDAVAAGGQSAVASAPFKNPNVQSALEDGSQAAAVNSALTAKLGLANTLTNGIAGGGTLSPDAVNKLYEAASNKGVNIYNPNGRGLRPLADVQKDLAQKSNLSDAQDLLKTTQAASNAAAAQLGTYQQMQSVLNGKNNPSGGWRVLPGSTLVNDVLAGWGNDTAEHARLLDTYGKKLVLDATGGSLGGRITDSDIAFLAKIQPSAQNSDNVNRTLVAAGVATNQRVAQQADFFNSTVPQLGANGAQRLWTQFVNSNPLFDPNSTAGAPIINKNVLSPSQYLQAVQNPQQAAQALTPQDPSSLPAFNPRNPSSSPYVVNNGAVIPNPVFWTPILTTHQQYFEQAPNPNQNALQSGIQNIVTTPTANLVRPRSE